MAMAQSIAQVLFLLEGFEDKEFTLAVIFEPSRVCLGRKM